MKSKFRLAIETSSSNFEVAITRDDQVLSIVAGDTRDAVALDLKKLAQEAMAQAHCHIKEIELIGVNRGPGNLSAVRSGISFANALSFSARIPIVGVDSFQLMYLSSSEYRQNDWVCSRSSAGGNVYAGLVRGGNLIKQVYGSLETIAERLSPHGETVFTGSASRDLALHFSDTITLFGAIDHPNILGLTNYLLDPSSLEHASLNTIQPITEQTGNLHD